MKTYKYIFILLLLLLPLVYANVGCDMEVASIKAYVDGEPQTLDWDDDTIVAKPGDTIQIRLRLENVFEDHQIDETSIEVDVYGSLELYDTDVERDNEDDDEDDKEIDNEDKKYYILDDFYLPENLDYDFYEFKLWYEYDVYIVDEPYSNNESENNKSTRYNCDDHSTTLEVNVKKPKEKIIDRDDLLINLTERISTDQGTIKQLLEQIKTCDSYQSDLTTCKEEKSSCTTGETYNVDYKNKYEGCNTGLSACREEKITCDKGLENMYTKTQMDTAKEKSKGEGRIMQKQLDDKNLMIIGAGAIVYFVMLRKKKNVGGDGESKPLKDEW